MKYDVCATIQIQVEAETEQRAATKAYRVPVEYWDTDSLTIEDVFEHGDE